MNRVVFLDIDGPMIPNTMILAKRRASWQRLMPPTTIAVVNEVCMRSDAKIVTNSYHNYAMSEEEGGYLTNDEDLKSALIRNGIPEGRFADDWRTDYPICNSRMRAVNDWLDDNGPATWIAFDDERFTDSKRLIWVDPAIGLNMHHLVKGLKRFGCAGGIPHWWVQ